MHITKNDIPVKIDAPGAIARQQTDFGAAFGVMGAEFFTMAKGADLAPLLEGLLGDMCHWPAGHSVRVEEDANLILFSPQSEHTPVLDHLKSRMGV
jgi:hypothetical protein